MDITYGYSALGVKSTHIETVTEEWGAFVARLRTPEVGEKDGSYFTRGPFKNNKRCGDNALGMSLVVLDGDSSEVVNHDTGEVTKQNGAPSAQVVHAVLMGHGLTHDIYSSWSNGQPDKGCRWRCVLPFTTQNKDELTQVVEYLIAMLQAEGVALANVSENTDTARVWFLPRVPDENALARYEFYHYAGECELQPGDALEDNPAEDYWIMELLRGGGDELHANALRITARMVGQGYDDEAINTVFTAARPALQRARGSRRVAELLDRHELQRTIDGARKKDYNRMAARKEAMVIGEGAEFTPLAEILSPQEMQHGLVLLSDGSRVAHRDNPRSSLALGDAKNHYRASAVPGKKGKKTPSIELWLSNPARLTAQGLTFHPGKDEWCNDPNGRNCLNTWRPYVRETGDPADTGTMLVLEHIGFLFGDRTEDFLDWLAHIEQYPGVLVPRGWLHIAPHKGVGRNTLANMLAHLWHGHTALALDLVGMLNTGFNERLSQKLLGVVDEIRKEGEARGRRNSDAQTLKQMVTAEVRTINEKYGRISIEFNVMRWLILSNHYDAIPIEDGDRRFEVAVCTAAPKREEYYARLVATTQRPETVNGFAAYLRARDLSTFSVGAHAKLTQAKVAVVSRGQSAVVRDLRGYMTEHPDAELFVSEEIRHVTELDPMGSNANLFASIAEAAGLEKLDRQRRLSNGKRARLYCRREKFHHWENSQGRIGPEHCPLAQGRVTLVGDMLRVTDNNLKDASAG